MKKLISILLLAGCFILCSCASLTVAPSIKHEGVITVDHGERNSGILAVDKKTGDRTVTDDFIDAYTNSWNDCHVVAKSSPIQYKSIGNFKYVIDSKHFAEALLLIHLDQNGITK